MYVKKAKPTYVDYKPAIDWLKTGAKSDDFVSELEGHYWTSEEDGRRILHVMTTMEHPDEGLEAVVEYHHLRYDFRQGEHLISSI